MMPISSSLRRLVSRCVGSGCLWASLLFMVSCQSPMFRGQSPDQEPAEKAEVARKTESDSGVMLVGDLARAWGTHYMTVESVAMVNNLPNTGSDPPNGLARSMLIQDMKARDVRAPEKLLASPTTALVLVQAQIPPGAVKGDQIDLVIRVPKDDHGTTSLSGGWLMETRLREMIALKNRVGEGTVVGIGEGPVVVDSVFNTSDSTIHDRRGRVLGGGRVTKPRLLGLKITADHVSVATSAAIGNAINNRFREPGGNSITGIANPRTDTHIDLEVPERYRRHLYRYLKVVQHLAIGRPGRDYEPRLPRLEEMLLEPTTSASAALQLEGIGKPGAEVLKKGLRSADPEVRFYSAEALAYLDDPESIPTLREFSASEPAFRWHALAALSTSTHLHAGDALAELLHVDSAETRYGAFQAIRQRNAAQPTIQGHDFHAYLMPTTGPGLVHVSRVRVPEIVVFGEEARWSPPKHMLVGREFLLSQARDGSMKVSRFSPGKDDIQEIVAPTVPAVIGALAKSGASYGDTVKALHTAKVNGDIEARLVVDARPKLGRVYQRNDLENQLHVASPISDLFSSRPGESDQDDATADVEEPLSDENDGGIRDETPAPKPSWFGKMTGWRR